jgi:hypothetical protein
VMGKVKVDPYVDSSSLAEENEQMLFLLSYSARNCANSNVWKVFENHL